MCDAFALGDWVRTQYGHVGRVYQKHRGCPEDDGWVAMQRREVTAEQKRGVWCSVLVHGGGSVVQPADTIRPLDAPPATLDNMHAAFYFREVRDAVRIT